MCPGENNGRIPKYCVDRFLTIERQLSHIDEKLSRLCANRKTAAERVWRVLTGAFLLIVGWLLAKIR